MDRDTKQSIAVIVIVAIIVLSGTLATIAYSGFNSPLTVIKSGSMQHSDKAEIGIIDTADIVVMKDPNSCSITTFVEGYQNGYEKFGDYGDVIIYKRPNANPVIHRAILWLDYLENDKWSAPALKDFDKSKWDVTDGDYSSMSGTLTIRDLGWRDLPASIDLNQLPKHSGYLTNGDNNYNASSYTTYFDQNTSIAGDVGLIQKEDLKAVAGFEIPYLGCIKMLINDMNVDQIPPNTIPCMFVEFIDLIALFIIVGMLLTLYGQYRIYCREKKQK